MAMLEMNHKCRLCMAAMPRKRSTNLFSPIGLLQKWASRIQDHFDVRASTNDGLPANICDKCKRRLAFIEKAAVDREDFREQARRCCTTLLSRGPQKHPKDTCGSAVSLDIANARPQLNRSSMLGRKLDFGQTLTAEGMYLHVRLCSS